MADALWIQLVTGDWIELESFWITAEGEPSHDVEMKLVDIELDIEHGEMKCLREAGMTIPIHAIARVQIREEGDIPGVSTVRGRRLHWREEEDEDETTGDGSGLA